MMKTIKIQAWPELYGFNALLGRFERSFKSPNPLFLDFSCCKEISSTGLVVFLLKTIPYSLGIRSTRQYSSNQFHENNLLEDILKLGFFYEMNKWFSVDGMFDTKLKNNGPFEVVEQISYGRRKVVSMPIYCLDLMSYDSECRRDAKGKFRKKMMDVLREFTCGYNFNLVQLVTILTEMVKNSADHSDAEAYFGMDLVEVPESKSLEIHFVYGDTGQGILEKVKKYCKMDRKFRKNVSSHVSLADAYHLALQRGFTTNPENIDNKGIGMSIIRDGSINVGLTLSVVDSFSRGVLTSVETVSHNKVRKVFFNYTRGQSKPFFYYGRIIGEKV